MRRHRSTHLTRLTAGRRTRSRDADHGGPARVIPFRPRAPRVAAAPPTSTTAQGGRLTRRRTATPGLSMTLSINVAEIVRALVAAEAQRLQADAARPRPHGRTRPARPTPGKPSNAVDAMPGASHTPALEVLPHLYGRESRLVSRFQRDVQTHARFLLRSPAGPIVRAVVGRAAALKSLGDLATTARSEEDQGGLGEAEEVAGSRGCRQVRFPIMGNYVNWGGTCKTPDAVPGKARN